MKTIQNIFFSMATIVVAGQRYQEIVIDRIKIPLDVGVYYPPTSQQHFVDCADCLRRTAPRSKPVRLGLAVRFEDWLDYYPTRLLDDPVSHCRDSQRELHTTPVSLWAGPRSGILSTHFVGKAFQYLRHGAWPASTR